MRSTTYFAQRGPIHTCATFHAKVYCRLTNSLHSSLNCCDIHDVLKKSLHLNYYLGAVYISKYSLQCTERALHLNK